MSLPYVDDCKYQIKLTKLSGNENKLRDNEIVGISPALPKVGQIFELLAEPRDIPKIFEIDGELVAGLRYVYTSEIMNLVEIGDSSITFETRNSTYRIDILKTAQVVR